jgi:FHS family Na+ dependent glucose MFS transporter 1
MAKTAGYYGAFVVLGIAVAALGPTLPGLAAHTRTALNAISFLFTARSLGYLLGSLLGGRLYDRLSGHPLMAGALILMAAMLALVPFLPILGILVAVLFILGMAEGVVEVGSNTLLLWVHRRNAAPFVNGLHFFFGVGAFLAPIVVAGALSLADDATWSYWLFALLALPVAGWLARLPSPVSQAASGDSSVTRVDSFLVALVAAFFFLYVGAESSFGGWIFSYATALNPDAQTTAAYLASAFWGSLTVGRLVAIPLAIRLRPRAILLADLIGCLVSLGLFLVFPGSAAALWIGTLGLGFCLASIIPTTLAFVGRHMSVTGQATGWFFVGLGLGAMTVPWLIGQLFETIGPQVMMFTILADLALALGLFLLLRIYTTRPVRN